MPPAAFNTKCWCFPSASPLRGRAAQQNRCERGRCFAGISSAVSFMPAVGLQRHRQEAQYGRAPTTVASLPVLDLGEQNVKQRIQAIAQEVEAGLGLAPPARVNLNDGRHFVALQEAFKAALEEKPLFPATLVAELERSACALLRFGADVFAHETGMPTPMRRPSGFPEDPPLDMDFDYLTLAVACQVVLHRPDLVSGMHSFKQLYGGRLITEIVPEVGGHVEFTGAQRNSDLTVQSEKEMRLHVDDADHLLRGRIQLLTGVKNLDSTATTFAVVPPDATLRGLGACNTDLLRAPLFRSYPPALIEPEQVPLRPLLFGPADAPMVQADEKPLSAKAKASPCPSFETPEAAAAWEAFHAYLKTPDCLRHVIVGPGDVLLLDNYRMMHGREEMPPVQHVHNRRWVKRLWLSSAPMEPFLAQCPSVQGHPRVFDRLDAFQAQIGALHPVLP